MGIGLIILTIVITFTKGKLYLFLLFTGVIMVGKGLMDKRMEYDK